MPGYTLVPVDWVDVNILIKTFLRMEILADCFIAKQHSPQSIFRFFVR